MNEPGVIWYPCSVKPPVAKPVLIWHRARPWGRFYKLTVGWWNSEEWRREDSNSAQHGIIYQPTHWHHITGPEGRER